jgi:hypothetical protein
VLPVVVKEYDWQKLKLFTWVGDYLCSHAGVHTYFYDNFNDKRLEFKKWIQIICDEAMKNAWELNPPQQFYKLDEVEVV